jgi:hypothetical protein
VAEVKTSTPSHSLSDVKPFSGLRRFPSQPFFIHKLTFTGDLQEKARVKDEYFTVDELDDEDIVFPGHSASFDVASSLVLLSVSEFLRPFSS